jgi:LacI family transcriptional regulator
MRDRLRSCRLLLTVCGAQHAPRFGPVIKPGHFYAPRLRQNKVSGNPIADVAADLTAAKSAEYRERGLFVGGAGKNSMHKRPHVALLIETSNSYARGLLRGIHRYLAEHRPWTVFLPEQGRGDAPPAWLSSWRGDGIIARIENERIAKAVKQAGLPAVDVSAARLLPDLPMVETDNEAIARLAFEHLAERGFDRFGFCGDDRFFWSRKRAEWFERFVTAAGHTMYHYRPKRAARARPWEQEQTDLAAWLERLPKPIGLMAGYDIRGWQVLEVCRRIGAAVPDQVAVVGVDNDELLCELAGPSLSSVIPDTGRTGYEAAELLERMMSGGQVAPSEHLIKPVGIAARQSTDVLAIADPDIARAVRMIRDRACDGLKVDALVSELAISRRMLEHRFKRLLGMTPHEQIAKVQIQRVMKLLRETDLPLATIAQRAGFRHVEYMSVAFKRQTGVAPREFRRRRGI